MTGWSAIFGAIFLNRKGARSGMTQSIKKTAHFRSLCGAHYVNFIDGDAWYLQEIKTPRDTIIHRGVEFEYVSTSIK